MEREKVETPLQKLEYNLNPVVSFFILPLFALANAGIEIRPESWSGSLEPVSLGIVTGLIIGKCFGILSFSALFVKLGLSELPKNTNWGTMTGASITAGIGFTMSIIISELTIEDPTVKAQAKLAILIASTLAGIIGMLVIKAFIGKEEVR